MKNTILSFSLLVILFSCGEQPSKQIKSSKNSFHFTVQTGLYGSPEQVYDKLTGDISPWWDHTFSGHPKQLFIEARPGGGFYEILDDSGDGVRHAVVTAAQRGKLLRMEGPLGMAGYAINLVSTYQLTAKGDSTILTLNVHGSGEFEPQWPGAIEKVWNHFIIEQFKPYWESQHQ